ncbi:helix-turn-helix domain-containing protein [Flavitalea sp. BT771]|uniref:winged helix-turn-helix transcriptional regulator n=1 Tax=Flavitalea sp. BT771 TaxID=3063329 RepID=UPI0026E22C7B|nr:helix-turn-helix domain-containing protein [Flavitalea sp. BT771]MDO6432766.1 helix-turn-helix domain-containing protein [Flavitalea sp. BT771]MDV6221958.1 helix-turn-helix domain-containing protein [Flavitalea sp. BT771]
MDRIRYLNALREQKNSPRFDHFLSMVQQAGNCPVRLTNNIIGGKWKPVILNLIVHEANRFGEILHIVEGLSKKVLTTHLRELEAAGIVERREYQQKPKKVEYILTEKGKTFIPVIEAMCKWGIDSKSITAAG